MNSTKCKVSVGMAWVAGKVHWCKVARADGTGRHSVKGAGTVAGDAKRKQRMAELEAVVEDADVLVRWPTRSAAGKDVLQGFAPYDTTLQLDLAEPDGRALLAQNGHLEMDLKARRVKVPDIRAVLASCRGHVEDGRLTMLLKPADSAKLAKILGKMETR